MLNKSFKSNRNLIFKSHLCSIITSNFACEILYSFDQFVLTPINVCRDIKWQLNRPYLSCSWQSTRAVFKSCLLIILMLIYFNILWYWQKSFGMTDTALLSTHSVILIKPNQTIYSLIGINSRVLRTCPELAQYQDCNAGLWRDHLTERWSHAWTACWQRWRWNSSVIAVYLRVQHAGRPAKRSTEPRRFLADAVVTGDQRRHHPPCTKHPWRQCLPALSAQRMLFLADRYRLRYGLAAELNIHSFIHCRDLHATRQLT